MAASPINHRHDDSVAAVPSSSSSPIAKTSRSSHGRGIPEFSDLLLACRHHLFLTGVLSLAAAIGLATVAWSVIDPAYQAEGLVRVREQQSVIFAAQTTRAQDVAFFRSQAKLVQSPQVLAAALHDEGLSELQGEMPSEGRNAWLAGLVRVETESGSEVMSITVGHQSPELAHALSNAITRSYLAEITHRLTSDRDQRERKLQQAAHEADERLDVLWDELNQLAESVGSDNAESITLRDEMKFQAYRDHARQLQAARLRGNQLQTQLAEQQRRHDQQVVQSDEAIELLLQQNVQVISSRKKLSKLHLEIEQMRKIAANPNSPQMKVLTRQRNFLASEQDQLVTRIRSQISGNLQNKNQIDQKDSLVKLQNQIELNRSEKEFLRERLSEINPVISQVAPKTAVPLDMSRHAVDRQSRLADSLWQSLQEMQIESQSQPRVTLLELATLPKHANHSRQLKAAVGAGMGGCFLVVFLIGYLEWRDCRVRSPRDVTSRSQYPVHGAASYSGFSRSWGSSRKQSALSGGVREAAARLMLRDQGNTTVMVTSCTATEPRHLVSEELAVLLASYHRRVLLIDCDTDRSQLSLILGASQREGMRQLSGQEGSIARDRVTSLIVPAKQTNLDFLPIGPVTGPSSWVDPRQLRAVISLLRTQYDVILVNGPSVMGSAESLLLAAEVDTSLFSVFMNQTRWNQLTLCEESVTDSGISVSGSLLHGGKRNIGGNLRRKESGLPLQLSSKRRVSSKQVLPSMDDQESQLYSRIDQLKHELRRAQSDAQSGAQRHRPAARTSPTAALPPNSTSDQ